MLKCCNCGKEYDEKNRVEACKVQSLYYPQEIDSIKTIGHPETGKILQFCPDCVRVATWAVTIMPDSTLRFYEGFTLKEE